jgi:hypothetical protein
LALVPGANADTKETVKTETTVKRQDNGSYKTETVAESKDAAGTNRVSEFDKNVKVGSGGERTITTISKTETDPKGLGNKSYSESKTKSEADARGNYTGKIDTDSVDAAGTKHRLTVEEKTKMNDDGSAKTTVNSKRVTDPKGMMNKSVAETEEVVKKDATGTIESTDVTKKVDGKAVE